MTSTIRDCSYSPLSGIPLSPLVGKIHLLNRGGAQDISARVGRLVTAYLDYKGPAVFEATVTKTRIEFTTLGSTRETRTLEYTGTQWKLTKNSGAAVDLPHKLQAEVGANIEETLLRIHTTANSKTDDSSSTTRALPIIHDHSSELAQLDTRLRRVEEALLHLTEQMRGITPRHDSLDTFTTLQRELQGLREEVHRLAQHHSETSSDAHKMKELEEQMRHHEQILRDIKAAHEAKSETSTARIKELQEQLAQSRKALELAQKKHEGEMLKAGADIQRLETAIEKVTPALREHQALKKAHDEMKHENAALAQRIKELDAQLAESTQALRTAQLNHEEAQTKGASQLRALEEKIKSMEQRLTETTSKLNAALQALRTSNEESTRQLAEAQGKQTDLEKLLATASSENTRLREENSALLSEVGAISQAKADLEERLRTLESTASASQANLLGKNTELEAQIRSQAEALRASEGKLAANQALAQRQTEQLKALESALAAEKTKIAGLEKEKEQQAQQIATLTAEKAATERQLAEQQERVRAITQEKTRVETLLREAQSTIAKQNQELEQLRKRLDAMKAAKAEQLKTSTTRVGEERAATAAAELEVEALLKNITRKTPVNSSSTAKVASL